MRPGARVFVLTITVSMLTTASAAAQEVRVSAVRGATDHALLGTPDGLAVEVGWDWSYRFGGRIGYLRYRRGVERGGRRGDRGVRHVGGLPSAPAALRATSPCRLGVVGRRNAVCPDPCAGLRGNDRLTIMRAGSSGLSSDPAVASRRADRCRETLNRQFGTVHRDAVCAGAIGS